MENSTSTKIKKGDKVTLVGRWNDPSKDEDIVIYTRNLIVKSFGKIRGTAVDVSDENIKTFIFPNSRLVKKGNDITQYLL